MRKREGDTHLLDEEVRNREIEREREMERETIVRTKNILECPEVCVHVLDRRRGPKTRQNTTALRGCLYKRIRFTSFTHDRTRTKRVRTDGSFA